MKTKDGRRFSKTDESNDLYLLIENYITKIQLSSADNLINIDNSIHEIRKSLKAVLAILLLFKTPSNLSQYLQWKSHFRVYIKTIYSFKGVLCFNSNIMLH